MGPRTKTNGIMQDIVFNGSTETDVYKNAKFHKSEII
jgi:hypothetical protein